MKILLALCVALCLAGTWAADDGKVRRCKPVSFTAIGFDPVTLTRYRYSSDVSRSLVLIEDNLSDDWVLTKSKNFVVYNYTNGQCTYTKNHPTLESGSKSARDSATELYKYETSDGRKYTAMTFDIADTVFAGLFDENCVATVATNSKNGVAVSISIFIGANTDNPDFTSLNEKLAITQDPSQCTEA
ncbi:hypothetical protein PoB_005631500 [Plakobranchus ocellatus]|uniref:Uncharacterized protein n=1 Tax=Plakobranchus ocellatus TaxID=259542 RepID=A0AAV4CDQ6_9GAST|nr:hypothetical protein PoB_005631500 [Plakobranchus ocellatus]